MKHFPIKICKKDKLFRIVEVLVKHGRKATIETFIDLEAGMNVSENNRQEQRTAETEQNHKIKKSMMNNDMNLQQSSIRNIFHSKKQQVVMEEGKKLRKRTKAFLQNGSRSHRKLLTVSAELNL